MSKPKLTFLIYASLLFLIGSLVKNDYLVLPEVINPAQLALSIFLLFLGFMANSLPWKHMLNTHGFQISSTDSIISIGLTIFGKYIPGKIWSIVGRSSYIANKYHYSNKDLTTISVDSQIITLWTGLVLGAVGLFLLEGLAELSWGFFAVWLIMTLSIFSHVFHTLTSKIFYLITKKNIDLPQITFGQTLKALPFFFLQWILWCAGFYFLASSILDTPLNPIAGVGFALAASFGIAAIFSPGGIGVREIFLAGYLMLAGLSTQDATTISVASRLWFLLGEVFIFVTAFLIREKF